MLSKDDLAHLVFRESDAHTLRWTTPTSIMLGLSPLRLLPGCAVDEKGAFATARVFNPIESRYQDEKLRVGKVLGVVLRGGTTYGWATQPTVMENKLGEYSLQPRLPGRRTHVRVEPKTSIIPTAHAMAIALWKHTAKPTRPKPNFDTRHLRQLERACRNPDDRVLRAVNRLYHRAKGVHDFRVICRMYGGGRPRKAMTFKALYEQHGIAKVPEQWGTGVSVYTKETADMLIGVETARDGTLHYIRLQPRDVPTDAARRGSPT